VKTRQKKLFLIIALVLALVFSGGVFAYVWTTAGATIGATAEGDFVTVEKAADQPDWQVVLAVLDDEVDWEFWPVVDDKVELNGLNNKNIIITQPLEKLEIKNCSYLSIVLKEYVEKIEIDASQHITIRAEKGYGEKEVKNSEHVTITVEPAPPPKPPAGDVPVGNLFVVTPHPDYTGDLKVHVYLTNTAALTKAYQYLNMKLYLEGSVEAPDYCLLTLQNGEVGFNLDAPHNLTHTLSVIGGSYSLVSDDPNEWSLGWSITPELYCEVTQR